MKTTTKILIFLTLIIAAVSMVLGIELSGVSVERVGSVLLVSVSTVSVFIVLFKLVLHLRNRTKTYSELHLANRNIRIAKKRIGKRTDVLKIISIFPAFEGIQEFVGGIGKDAYVKAVVANKAILVVTEETCNLLVCVKPTASGDNAHQLADIFRIFRKFDESCRLDGIFLSTFQEDEESIGCGPLISTLETIVRICKDKLPVYLIHHEDQHTYDGQTCGSENAYIPIMRGRYDDQYEALKQYLKKTNKQKMEWYVDQEKDCASGDLIGRLISDDGILRSFTKWKPLIEALNSSPTATVRGVYCQTGDSAGTEQTSNVERLLLSDIRSYWLSSEGKKTTRHRVARHLVPVYTVFGSAIVVLFLLFWQEKQDIQAFRANEFLYEKAEGNVRPDMLELHRRHLSLQSDLSKTEAVKSHVYGIYKQQLEDQLEAFVHDVRNYIVLPIHDAMESVLSTRSIVDVELRKELLLLAIQLLNGMSYETNNTYGGNVKESKVPTIVDPSGQNRLEGGLLRELLESYAVWNEALELYNDSTYLSSFIESILLKGNDANWIVEPNKQQILYGNTITFPWLYTREGQRHVTGMLDLIEETAQSKAVRGRMAEVRTRYKNRKNREIETFFTEAADEIETNHKGLAYVEDTLEWLYENVVEIEGAEEHGSLDLAVVQLHRANLFAAEQKGESKGILSTVKEKAVDTVDKASHIISGENNTHLSVKRLATLNVALKESLAEVARASTNRDESYSQAAMVFTNAESDEGSAIVRAHKSMEALLFDLGLADEHRRLFMGLYEGVFYNHWKKILENTRSVINSLWYGVVETDQERYFGHMQVDERNAFQSKLYDLLDKEYQPFLVRKNGTYEQKTRYGAVAGFSTDFIRLVNSVGSSREMAADTISMLIESYPSSLDNNSRETLYSTKIEVVCQNEKITIVNENSYSKHKVTIDPDLCNRVELSFLIGNRQPSIIYEGRTAILDFLLNYRYGKHDYEAAEFGEFRQWMVLNHIKRVRTRLGIGDVGLIESIRAREHMSVPTMIAGVI